jgi:starvation-inducible outer membrane lipoprotein
MKSKIFTALLSFSLFFSGCSSKSVNLSNSSQMQKSVDVRESTTGEKILVGTLLVGVTALVLTTAAVVILLLVPKEYEPR